MSDPEAQWLVAICGLPGVGKSTVARYVTDLIGAERLRTDVVRQDLFDDPEYTSAERAAVYEEIYDRTRDLLEDGDSVVLDATFADRGHRETVREIANGSEARFQLMRVVCDHETVERRIVARDDISDADLEVYRWFKDEFDPIETEHVTVDNSNTKSETRSQVEALF